MQKFKSDSMAHIDRALESWGLGGCVEVVVGLDSVACCLASCELLIDCRRRVFTLLLTIRVVKSKRKKCILERGKLHVDPPHRLS